MTHELIVGTMMSLAPFSCDLFLVSSEKAALVADAGVVNDEHHVVGVRRGRSHLFGFGDVKADCLDSGLRNGRRIARNGVQLAGTAGAQLAREGDAAAAIGTGYECDCIVYPHKRPFLGGRFRRVNMIIVIFEGEGRWLAGPTCQ
jgi:hypothetical protein